MAFQTGTQVDPRLLDYSGYAQGMTQAAAINAQALASLGQAVGKGIEEFNEKKLQKEQKKQATPVIASFLRQIDPTLSEEQSNAGATSFINSVGIEGVEAAIPMLTIQAMKSQTEIRKAQLEALGELGKEDQLSITDQQKVAQGFESDGVYTNQGFYLQGGKLYQTINPPGLFNKEEVPVTSGPVYEAARAAGLLMQTPDIDTSMVGQPPVGTGTVLRESGSPNPLNLDIPEEEAPTLGQIEDITSQIDYGEFDVPKPKVIQQEGFASLTATNRPKTYEEFVAGIGKRKGTKEQLKKRYQSYLNDFKYKYPKTYEEYSRGGQGDMTQSYTDIYLPRFY